jgi:formate dehydrogenase maturation protein FdhE
MSTSESQAILGALAVAQAAQTDLAELLAFYHDLFVVQFAARSRMPALSTPDSRTVQQRAEAGQPQLGFEELGLDPASLGVLVNEVLGVLAHHDPGWTSPLYTGPGSDLIQRARRVFETWHTLTAPGDQGQDGIPHDVGSDPIVDQAIAFALVPYLQRAAEALRPALDQVQWRRPVCPVCGGEPNLALLEAERGARQLVCSRCDIVWGYTRVGCPFCQSQERQTYFLGQDELYRLYVCPTCKRYLKTVDLREAGRAVVPAVERLLTVQMDLVARQEGYVG